MSGWLVTLHRTVRRLAAQPIFTLLVAGLLGVGLAATAGFVILVQSVLYAPLPYTEPEALYGLRSLNQRDGLTADALSVADFAELRREQSTFAGMAAYRGDFVSYTPDSGPTRQWFGARVTGDFFTVMGVEALRGRTISRAECAAGGAQVALLSEDLWIKEFDRDEAILGTTLDLNGRPFEIIGILPKRGSEPSFADVWLPFPDSSPEYFLRDARYWTVIARLGPGASAKQATAELKTLAANLAEVYPKTNRHWTFELVPLLEMRVSGARQSLFLGTLTAALLLIVTGLNIANLLLARGTRRQTEMALHRALGANGRQLASAALLEAGLLALFGGLIATGLLVAGFDLLLPRLPTALLPRMDELEFTLGDLGPLFAMTLLTGLLAGLWPAFQARRRDLLRLLNQVAGRHTQDIATKRARHGLLVLQIAVTLFIVSAAALVLDQLRDLLTTPMGFEPAGVDAFLVSPDERKFQDFDEFRTYYDRILAALREHPDCAAAEMTTFPPLFGANLTFSFEIDNYSDPDERAIEAAIQCVSPGVFSLLDIPVRQGRALTSADAPHAPLTAVINEALAEKYFPGENPLGRRIRVMPWIESDWRVIVGVVGTVKQDSLTEPPAPQIYLSATQNPWIFAHLLVRSNRPGSGLAGQVESIVRTVDPDLAVTHFTLEELRDRQTARARTLTVLMTGFAIAAALLAAFGVYALVTLSVVDQTREIGIRMAIGADRAMIQQHFLRFGLRAVGWGTLAGALLALIGDRLLRPFLGEAGGAHLPLLAASVGALLLIGVVASLLPARRAAGLNPNAALRQA